MEGLGTPRRQQLAVFASVRISNTATHSLKDSGPVRREQVNLKGAPFPPAHSPLPGGSGFVTR